MPIQTLTTRHHKLTQLISDWQAQSPFKQTVQLVAVSKQHSSDSIRILYEIGQRIFAENYLQEALSKQKALLDLSIEWHYIGSIQSNKTRTLATHFSWIHSVERLSTAERLNQHRPATLGKLNVCLQVNIDQQATKSGCAPDEVPMLVAQISRLANIELRGLMCLPAADNNDAFVQLQQLFTEVRDVHANPSVWDCLSMGMSNDMEAAIIAGATHVRIGTALFGMRS